MNYRLGLLRAYVVLSVLWASTILLVLPSERLHFWDRQTNTLTTVHGHWEADPTVRPQEPQGGGGLDLSKYGPGKYRVTTDGGVYEVTIEKFAPKEPSRIQRGIWLACVLVLPPVLGYAAIFLVSPWVYRGFRPVART